MHRRFVLRPLHRSTIYINHNNNTIVYKVIALCILFVYIHVVRKKSIWLYRSYHTNITTSVHDESLQLSSRLLVLQQQQQPMNEMIIKFQYNNVTQQQQEIIKRNTITQPSTTTPKHILFVHIGKAGGETIKHILQIGCHSMKQLQKKQQCYQNLPKSILSNTVHGYMHCFQIYTNVKTNKTNKRKTKVRTNRITSSSNNTTASTTTTTTTTTSSSSSLFDTYLFNVRHPVERILSWYRYVHPYPCQYQHEQYQQQHKQNQPIGLSCTTYHDILRYQNQNHQHHVTNMTNSILLSSSSLPFTVTFFQVCFPSIHHWANAVSKSTNINFDTNPPQQRSVLLSSATTNEFCHQLGYHSLLGQLDKRNASIATHLIANYQHYMNRTIFLNPNNNIMIIRTKYLWDDIRSIDLQLNGTGNFGSIYGTKYNHGMDDNRSHTTTTNNKTSQINNPYTKITPQNIQIFCCVLLSEIQRYHFLLLHATNLQVVDQQQTIQESIEYCGYTTWDEMIYDCPNRIRQF